MLQPQRARGRPPRSNQLAPEHVLSVAAELFAERGIHAVTVGDIAAGCGVDRASVYYHFGDRAAVVRSLGDALFEDLAAALTALTPVPAVEVRLAAYLLHEQVVLTPHRRIVATLLTDSVSLSAGLGLQIERVDAVLEQWLHEGRAGGVFTVRPHDALGFINSLAIGALIDPPADRRAFANRLALAFAAIGVAEPAAVIRAGSRAAQRLTASTRP